MQFSVATAATNLPPHPEKITPHDPPFGIRMLKSIRTIGKVRRRRIGSPPIFQSAQVAITALNFMPLRFAVLIFLSFCSGVLRAQQPAPSDYDFKVVADRPDALYQTRETVTFKI